MKRGSLCYLLNVFDNIHKLWFLWIVARIRSTTFSFFRYMGNVGILGEEELVVACLVTEIGRLTCFERLVQRGD